MQYTLSEEEMSQLVSKKVARESLVEFCKDLKAIAPRLAHYEQEPILKAIDKFRDSLDAKLK